MEKEPVWRDIWKEMIEASGTDLKNKSKDLPTFQTIEKKYPTDKMILFEKAIALEVLGNRESATKYYSDAADENNGLPVKHWRKRAKYFLDRITQRGCCCTTDLNPLDSCKAIQWNVYYNIHSYCFLDPYIRYLAISSVSRVHSEPAMAIVIFRTCLEIGLWTYFENECNQFNTNYQRRHKTNKTIGLDDLLSDMFKTGTLHNCNDEYKTYDKIRYEGNIAAHPGRIKENKKPFNYTDEELIIVLDYFNKTMRYLNKRACPKNIS